MAPRTPRLQTLTPGEVAKLGDQLAGGGRPRVQLSGPQFPDGSTGTVIRIGDPAVDGGDYITVRVKLNGVSDELAFAPGELSLRRRPARGSTGPADAPRARRSARAARDPAAGSATAPAPAEHPAAEPGAPEQPAMALAAAPAAMDSTAPIRTTRPRVASPRAAAAARAPAARPSGTTVGRAATAQTRSAGSATGDSASAVSAGGRRRKAASPPKVSFSITSSGATWAVSATRGAKGIVRQVAVLPGAVTAIADLLEQPALIEAVADINETAWAEAQARADQLRAELDRLEAVLAAHRSPG